jgi:hypothetical protein
MRREPIEAEEVAQPVARSRRQLDDEAGKRDALILGEGPEGVWIPWLVGEVVVQLVVPHPPQPGGDQEDEKPQVADDVLPRARAEDRSMERFVSQKGHHPEGVPHGEREE